MDTQHYPLVVDLDGTLVRSDLLVESAFSFVRHHPLRCLEPLAWLVNGKAMLKQRLASEVKLDIPSLPYDAHVVEFLKEQKALGRQLVLATASAQPYADAVAAHLGLFDKVLATHGETNLSARAKRDFLIRKYGERGFDYLGNSTDDLAVWSAARNAYIANPEFGVEARAKRLGNVERVIRTPEQPWMSWFKQLRLHQWLKNLLIFVPLIAAHRISDLNLIFNGLLGFLFFSLCASSVYLLNDLIDLEDDRQHRSKRFRPLASGAVPVKLALPLLPGLLLIGFIGSALWLPWKFTLALLFYYALTLAYTLFLKRMMPLDVIVLAVLYTARIVAGTFAFEVQLTFWMLAFSMFLFLSLALVKRYTELKDVRSTGKSAQGRGYLHTDLEMIASLGAASGYLAVMVLALYIQDPATRQLYGHPQVIWLACPILLYWITRIWMVAHRGWMHDDPVIYAIKDRNSLLLAGLFAIVFWAAT